MATLGSLGLDKGLHLQACIFCGGNCRLVICFHNVFFSEEKISSPLMHSHQAPEFSVLIGYCSVHSLRSIGLK